MFIGVNLISSLSIGIISIFSCFGDSFFDNNWPKKIIGIIALLLTMNISPMALAYSMLATSISSQIINSWPNRKLLGYRYIDQLKDILPEISLAAAMGFCVSFIEWLGLNDFVTLIIQTVLGALIYITGAYLLKFESFQFILTVVSKKEKKPVAQGTVADR